MSNPFPSIEAIFRQVERKTLETGNTHVIEPSLSSKKDVVPLQTVMKEQWKMTMYDDRTLHVPHHIGRHVLPSNPLFNQLVRFAHEQPPRLCIRDVNFGYEATHLQLLTDVLAFRERIWKNLSDDVKKGLEQHQEIYISILASGGYDFTVAILAALALGAAVVPMAANLPVDEALYFITKSKSTIALASDEALRLELDLEKALKRQDPKTSFTCIPIAPSLRNPPLSPTDIFISSDLSLDDNAPGVVIFTSGTSGPPKGAVMRRAFVHDEALAVAGHYNITSQDVLLHTLPVNHATGIGIMFFPFLIAGALMEFKSGSFDPEWVWGRWRNGGITFFSGVPTVYMRLMRYFQKNLASRKDTKDYIQGARSLRECICGTSPLPKPIADFWTEVLGKRILLRYGATEIGAVLKVHVGDDNVPDGSVGKLFAGCDVRLSEGDSGEILVKSPGMFSKYLHDAEATASAHNEEGYYKTGDIARKEGEYYWILGRASVDIIKSGGVKISALDVEREILALPYVAEVMVVGVPDLEFGERVAAAVCLRSERDLPASERKHALKDLKIKTLRKDLRERLAGNKLPTILRVIPDELPKSGSGKVVKKTLGPQFFPPEDMSKLDEVQIWHPTQKHDTKSKL